MIKEHTGWKAYATMIKEHTGWKAYATIGFCLYPTPRVSNDPGTRLDPAGCQACPCEDGS